jgi:acyl-CoA thioesterase
MPKTARDGANPSGEPDFLDLIGIDHIEDEDGRPDEIAIAPRHLNPFDIVHGGLIYTLADPSMGGPLLPELADNELTATIEIKINYLTAVCDGAIRADTKIIQRGRRVAVIESDVYNGERLVVKALGSFAIFEVR